MTLDRPVAQVAQVFAEPQSRSTAQPEPQELRSSNGGHEADVVVIGGGPGGYVAAIRAAQLGGKVILIENQYLGGTCLNVGCIPTKALIASAEVFHQAQHAADFGVKVEGVSADLEAMLARKDKIVTQLRGGVEFLLKKNGVEVIKGTGKLLKDRVVQVGDRQIRAANVILALGSAPARLNLPGLGDDYITSDEAVFLKDLPRSMVILGAGAIGMEFAHVYSNLGVQVTVVEMMDHVLPGVDPDLSTELEKSFKRRGIKVHTSSKAKEFAAGAEGRKAMVMETPQGDQRLEAEVVFQAVGRRANTANAGLEELGLRMNRGLVLVDSHMRTNLPGVYAIGDIVGGAQLAHKASAEGVVAAENIRGLNTEMDYSVLPGCVYTWPEVATVGMTEAEAREKGYDVRVGRFDFRALGRAMAIGSREGFVKVVTETKYGEILGVHIIGPHATEIIQEAVVAMKAEATIDELAHAIHAHPTLPEAIMEAALDAKGEAIHKA